MTDHTSNKSKQKLKLVDKKTIRATNDNNDFQDKGGDANY